MVEGGWSYIESLRLSIGSNEYCRASNAVVIQDKKKANEVKEKKSKPHRKIPPPPVGVYGIITDTKHFNVSDQRVVNNSALKCTHLRANRHTRIRIQYLIRNSLSMCVCQMVCFVEQKRTPVEMCPLCYKINLFCYLHLLLPDVIGVVSRLFRLLRFYLGHKIFKRTMGAIPMQQTRKKKYKKNEHPYTCIYISDRCFYRCSFCLTFSQRPISPLPRLFHNSMSAGVRKCCLLVPLCRAVPSICRHMDACVRVR